MDRSYDSEFTKFMDSFLKHHPEVAKEQMYRWHQEWDPKPTSLEEQVAAADLESYIPHQ